MKILPLNWRETVYSLAKSHDISIEDVLTSIEYWPFVNQKVVDKLGRVCNGHKDEEFYSTADLVIADLVREVKVRHYVRNAKPIGRRRSY